MRTLVTGTAGFVGSHLAEALVARGDDVVGVDCFTPYYDGALKRRNLTALEGHRNFAFLEADLRTSDLLDVLDGVEVVYHQAGQPGVRASWDHGFAEYVEHNVLVTQRLLEACRTAPVRRFVYASSSSVYGSVDRPEAVETDLPRPYSPYGVTKLSAEQLCSLYATNWGLPTVSLRYFTVFGPRQRPDMAFHRLIDAVLRGAAFPLYGDGKQERDFTFVQDVVRANLLAAERDVEPGTVVNVAGGTVVSMLDVIDAVSEAAGSRVEIEWLEAQAGDVRRTSASTDACRAVLGWAPQVELRQGLEQQVRWHRDWLAGNRDGSAS